MLRKLPSSENSVEEESITSSENVKIKNVFHLSNEEKLLLEEQIRKFVQLVTQNYLLSCGKSKISYWNSELNLLKESSKQILFELKDIALKNSLFAAYNLEGALNIINECEQQKDAYSTSKCPNGISYIVRKKIFHNEVFMYPELLPKCGFVGKDQNKKVTFTKAEDNLIALGLEKFSGEFAPVHKIQNHLMPCKEVDQIKIRIKNLRSSKSPSDNPVKYYFAHKKAPPMPRNVQTFDPNEVKAPQDLGPSNDLPEWIMSLFSRRQYRNFLKKSISEKAQPNYKKIFAKPLFILPKGLIIQNHNMLNPVISPKWRERNFIKPPKILPKILPILPKGIVKDDKKFPFDVENESYSTNDIVKTQEIDKPLDNLNDKINECSKEIITGKYETSDKAMTTHLNAPNNKFDKTSIACDVVIETEIIDEHCDSSQNTSLSDSDTAKMPSFSLLNTHNEQNSNFVETENKDAEIDASVFEIMKQVQSHHIKQEIKDDSDEMAQICKFVPGESDKQDINISKHTLITKQVSKSVDYIPDQNDKEYGIVIKSEFIEESNDSLKHACKIDFDLEETLLVDFGLATNGCNHSLQKRNLSLEKLPILNKKRKILHDNFHSLTEFPKSKQTGEQHVSYPMQNLKNNSKIVNTIITDMVEYCEGISIKSEIIDSETSLLQNTNDISDKLLLRTTKNVIKSNSLEKAHVKKSINIIKRKRRKQNCLTISKVRKKN